MAEDGEFGKKIFTVVRGEQMRPQAKGVGARSVQGFYSGKYRIILTFSSNCSPINHLAE